MKEQYHKFFTEYLEREFEMLVFGHSGFPVLLFPTSKGRYYQNKDFGLIDSAAELIENGLITIYCPDSIDEMSWYNYDIHPADRVLTHMGYEHVILNDVIGFIKHETGAEKIAAAGCGFGGYHAANLAFRHPDKIKYLFTMGGSFNIKRFISGHYDDNCYFNNPVDYLPNLDDKWYLNHLKEMGIILGTGEYDHRLDENLNMSDILSAKNISHWLDVKQGFGHDWPEWRKMFPEYLSKISF